MSKLGEKVRERRAELSMNQQELAQKAGIAVRTIGGYESGTREPRAEQLYLLAKALGVSTEYLRNDAISDPAYGLDRMEYIEETRNRTDIRTAVDLDAMLQANLAMLAGGEVSFEAKQAYFEAIMDAFVDCKRTASEKFGSSGSKEQ